MNLIGDRIKWSGARVIHTRPLYRRRLLVQRGHSMIAGPSQIEPVNGPLWSDAIMEDVPSGVTWKPLNWPKDEIQIPFDKDALEVWDDKGNLR